MKQLKCSFGGVAEIEVKDGIEQFKGWIKKPRKVPEGFVSRHTPRFQLYTNPNDIIREEVADYEGRKRGL